MRYVQLFVLPSREESRPASIVSIGFIGSCGLGTRAPILVEAKAIVR